MFLFKVLYQHDHHHDVDDRHDYVDDDFDAAMLMVIMMMLMVVEIYAHFYHFRGETCLLGQGAQPRSWNQTNSHIPKTRLHYIKFILKYVGPF